MFKIKEWKFNTYCKMYSELFGDKISHYDKIDYIALQKKVIDKLTNTSFTDRQHIEVILKDNLQEFKDGSTDLKQFYGVMIGLFSGIASLFLKNYIDGGTLDSLSVFYVIFYVTIFFALYTLIIEVVFNSRKIVKRGFYEWCLNLMDKFENGKFGIDSATNKAFSQVVATIENGEESKVQVRDNSNQANGNWNVEISIPSLIESLAGLYSVGKFVRRMFRKKK